MDRTWLLLVLVALLGLLFAASYAAFWMFFRAMARTRRRIRLSELRTSLAADHPPVWLRAVGLTLWQKGSVQAELGQLLASAGIRLTPAWYSTLQRLGVMGSGLLTTGLWLFRGRLLGVVPLHPLVWISMAAGLVVCLMCHRYFLELIKAYRTQRIVEEIFAVSRQLLYFSGSPLHLHGKLSRCLPHTRLIRHDWHLLLNDWYHDAEGAVNRFRMRLSTEEAYGFAETLQYLRLYDNEAYYTLLRQRVQDYKEKLEMIRDSRKESVSYGLFVLAAIPIMYTFQIFMYPWVQEGQRLFQTLN